MSSEYIKTKTDEKYKLLNVWSKNGQTYYTLKGDNDWFPTEVPIEAIGKDYKYVMPDKEGGKRKSRKQKKSLKRKSRKARKSHKKRR